MNWLILIDVKTICFCRSGGCCEATLGDLGLLKVAGRRDRRNGERH